jgi:hypothetical protein
MKLYLPQKIFVFTARGWSQLPFTDEGRAGIKLKILGAEFPKFEWGTYDLGGNTITAIGMRHPQGALGQLMVRGVRCGLSLPCSG